MFTYIDPTVRERLEAQGKLYQIDRQGKKIGPGSGPAHGVRLNVMGPIPLPLSLGEAHYDVDWYVSVRRTELSKIEEMADELRAQNGQAAFATLATSMAVNSVLILGDPGRWKNPLVRVHSSCLTGDVFGSERCECGPQIQTALQRINEDPDGGMVVYMAGHEGRGIGLWAKAATYLLQDAGEDTYQANRSLGLPDDSRDFSDAATLLRFFLGDRPFRLLTNNPQKVTDLEKMGLTRITRVKHVIGVTERNRRYLAAKRARGHSISPEDIGGE